MKLTKDDVRAILAFDADYRKKYHDGHTYYDTGLTKAWQCRRSFRYNYLKPKPNGEVQFVTIAVRIHKVKTGERTEWKVIGRSATDSDIIEVRDLEYCGICGWVVLWPDCSASPYGCYVSGSDRYICNHGWNKVKYKWREYLASPWEPTINPEALEGTKYQHSGYDYIGRSPLLDHLKLYRQNKGVEFLAKAKLDSLLCPAGLKRLQRSREFFAFVRTHLKEISKSGYSFPVIQYAQIHGMTLKTAAQHFDNVASWKYYKLPKSALCHVDEITAHHIKTRIHQNEYARYLEHAEQAGWDMDDPHVYLPPKRRWKARLEHAEAEANAVEERKLNLAEKEVNKKILKVALKFAKLTEYRRGKFSLEIPTCCNELRAEGKKMGNCIGSMGYDMKTINGESLMLFVRKDGDFYSDIEIDRRNQRIRQHYAKKNSKPDRWAASFADEIVKRYRRIERKLRRAE